MRKLIGSILITSGITAIGGVLLSRRVLTRRFTEEFNAQLTQQGLPTLDINHRQAWEYLQTFKEFGIPLTDDDVFFRFEQAGVNTYDVKMAIEALSDVPF